MLKYKLSQIKKFSKKILSNLSQSDCIYLFGELGSGKTTFTRCLIHLLQEKNKVKKCEVLSPTYTLLQEYEIKSTTVMHYDLYRIKQKEELDNIGLFEDKGAINVIEWPEILKSYNIKCIKFDFSYSDDFKNRNLIISSNYSNKIIDEFK